MLTQPESKNHHKLMKFCSTISATDKYVKTTFNNSDMNIHC
jgi:hypothetical protein